MTSASLQYASACGPGSGRQIALSAATMLAMTSRSAGRMSGQSSRISFGLNESCNFLRLAPRRLEDRCRLGRRLDVCGRRAAVEPVLDHVLEKREMPAE